MNENHKVLLEKIEEAYRLAMISPVEPETKEEQLLHGVKHGLRDVLFKILCIEKIAE